MSDDNTNQDRGLNSIRHEMSLAYDERKHLRGVKYRNPMLIAGTPNIIMAFIVQAGITLSLT